MRAEENFFEPVEVMAGNARNVRCREWCELAQERLNDWFSDAGLFVRDVQRMVWHYYLNPDDLSEPVLFYQPRECTNHAPPGENRVPCGAQWSAQWRIPDCCRAPKKWYRIDPAKPVAFRFVVPPRLKVRLQIKPAFCRGLGLHRPVFFDQALTLSLFMGGFTGDYVDRGEDEDWVGFCEVDSRCAVPRNRRDRRILVRQLHDLGFRMEDGQSERADLLIAKGDVVSTVRSCSSHREYHRRASERLLRSWKIYQRLFRRPGSVIGLLMHVKKTTHAVSFIFSLVTTKAGQPIVTSNSGKRKANEDEPIVQLSVWNMEI